MLRRATKVWDLAYPFVSYLETVPGERPDGTESRFYWTRDNVGRKPVLTLHHVAMQEFPDGRVLVADKQFYASRQIDAALLIALAIPDRRPDRFDLIVSVKARADAVSGAAGRMLRGRIEQEMCRAENVLRVDSRQPQAVTRRSRRELRNSRIRAAFRSLALNQMSASGPTSGMAPRITSTSTFDSIFDTSDGGGPY